jgi:CheY-like chemotaxis protein/class 3 adenylate cyclase
MSEQWRRDEEEVHFLPESQSYCISYIDIVNSTGMTAGLSEDLTRRYYSLFLNSVGTIVKSYGAKVIKTLGDGMLFYMPATRNCEDLSSFDQALDCCFALLDERHSINAIMNSEGMPPLKYRVSADYGRVQVAKTSAADDLFGSTINICTKINRLARPNGMVIGGDLYRIVSRHFRYQFEEMGSYKVDRKFEYPVYFVSLKNKVNSPVVAHTAPVQMSSGIQKKIMLVDDEADILLAFKMILGSAGYDVDGFDDAEQALADFAKSRSDSYALVILDVRMPKINGLQLFQRMKAINSRTKIMFVTALDAIDELKTILPDPAQAVLRKPVEKDQFITKVHTLVREDSKLLEERSKEAYAA